MRTGRGDVTPRRLRVYVNRANIIDFSEVEDAQPSLNISLLEGDTGVTEYPLRVAAFSSINTLSLFFVRDPRKYPVTSFGPLSSNEINDTERFRGRGMHSNILHRLQGRNQSSEEGRQQQARNPCCECPRRIYR